MTLNFLNTKAKQDIFLKMTPNHRRNWITWAQNAIGYVLLLILSSPV